MRVWVLSLTVLLGACCFARAQTWGYSVEAFVELPDGPPGEDNKDSGMQVTGITAAQVDFGSNVKGSASASVNGPNVGVSSSGQVPVFTGIPILAGATAVWTDQISAAIGAAHPAGCVIVVKVHGHLGPAGRMSAALACDVDSDSLSFSPNETDTKTLALQLTADELAAMIGQSLPLRLSLNVEDMAGQTPDALVSLSDFSHTAQLVSIDFFDTDGNTVNGISVTGVSGIQYPVNAVAVPEPSSVLFFGAGFFVFGISFMRRHSSSK